MSGSPSLAAWIWLLVAIGSEVGATAALRQASDHPNATNVGLVVAGYLVSFLTFAVALRKGMEVGTGYAVWSAVGTAAIAVIGVLAFGESTNPWKFVFLGVIVVGVVGLNLVGGHSG